MSFTTKISTIFISLFLYTGVLLAQNDSAWQKEMNEFSGKIAGSFSLPKTELSKVKSEMFFILFHIRNFRIANFEIFANSDTLLKKSVNNYFKDKINSFLFTHIEDQDIVLPLVIKNLYPPSKEVNSDYNYLIWEKGIPKKKIESVSIYSSPVFMYLSSGPDIK